MFRWLWKLLEAFDDPQPFAGPESCKKCQSLQRDLDVANRAIAEYERVARVSSAGIDTTFTQE